MNILDETTYERLKKFAQTSVIAEGLNPEKEGVSLVAERIMIMARGLALNMDPAQSLSTLFFVKGRIVMSAESLLARAFTSGKVGQWDLEEDLENKRVVLRVERVSDPHIKLERVMLLSDFTHLTKGAKEGSGWKNYPMRMLRARMTAFAIRDIFPEATCGTITIDEAAEIFDDATISNGSLATVGDTERSNIKSERLKDDLRTKALARAEQATPDATDAAEIEAQMQSDDPLVQPEVLEKADTITAEQVGDDLIDEIDRLIAGIGDEDTALAERLTP